MSGVEWGEEGIETGGMTARRGEEWDRKEIRRIDEAEDEKPADVAKVAITRAKSSTEEQRWPSIARRG